MWQVDSIFGSPDDDASDDDEEYSCTMSLLDFGNYLTKYMIMMMMTVMMVSVLFSLLGFSDYPTTELMEQPA